MAKGSDVFLLHYVDASAAVYEHVYALAPGAITPALREHTPQQAQAWLALRAQSAFLDGGVRDTGDDDSVRPLLAACTRPHLAHAGMHDSSLGEVMTLREPVSLPAHTRFEKVWHCGAAGGPGGGAGAAAGAPQ